MADETPQGPGDGAEERPRTPFDNPFFLPIMLWVFVAWFGYDAWIVPMEEHLAFNRYGFFVVLALALWFTWKAVKERREEREAKVSTQPPGGS